MSESPDVTSAIEAARQAAQQALETSRAAAQGTGNALVPTGGTDVALSMKANMADARAQVIKARNAALEAQQVAREALEAQKRALDAQLRELDVQLAPLREQIAMLTEGVWTINLYVGRDEEIVTLAQGAPAPAGTPIHVRQQVLAMDEESAVAAETGGMDALSIEAFDRWITADPAHLQQVLPEQRGVVVLMPRREDRDYGDPWKSAQVNQMNKQSWWLIRNGENLYRMTTDLQVGRRLVPARNEFTDLFVDRWTKEPLRPGTDAWLEAEKAAGARERHFMRIALVLQGLIDRTAVFAPLPKPGLSLLTPQDYDDGHVVLIADDENQLTTGRTPFYQWLSGLNSQLRVGMRVMIATEHSMWPSRSTEAWRHGHHERINPGTASEPQSGQVYTIARKGDHPGHFVVTYPRTDMVWARDEWGHHEFRQAKTNASCVIKTTDKFVIPIDLVDVATMRQYMTARTERHSYVNMFPTLRAAIAFKEAEAAAEAPFRDLLAAQVAQTEGVTVDEAAALVSPVIDWWKVGNKWFRAMQGDPAAETKAAKAILAERARVKAANDGSGDDERIVQAIRAEHPDVLLVARRKDGRYVALTPTPRKWAKPVDGTGKRFNYRATPDDVFVTRHEYTKTGRHTSSTAWQIVAPATVSRWITLYTADAWAKWNKTASLKDHLTDSEIQAFIDTHAADPVNENGQVLLAITYEELSDRYSGPFFMLWWHPGPVEVPARRLTQELPHVEAHTQRVVWERLRDGSLTFKYGTARPDNTTVWSVQHNYLLDGGRLGEVVAPWQDDARNNFIVHVEDDTFAVALRHATVREQARVERWNLSQAVQQFTDRLAEQWLATEKEKARLRFLEDFRDASLWPEHAKSLDLTYPYGDRSRSGDSNPGGAVQWLVRRAFEDGNPPYGMTVGEFIDQATTAGEAVWDAFASWSREFTGEYPEDLRVLRFPNAPGADATHDEETA